MQYKTKIKKYTQKINILSYKCMYSLRLKISSTSDRKKHIYTSKTYLGYFTLNTLHNMQYGMICSYIKSSDINFFTVNVSLKSATEGINKFNYSKNS